MKSEPQEFWVIRQNTTNVCRVQRLEERPIYGNKFLGPYKSKKAATQAMCDKFDPAMDDPNKCWQVVPEDACKVDEN